MAWATKCFAQTLIFLLLYPACRERKRQKLFKHSARGKERNVLHWLTILLLQYLYVFYQICTIYIFVWERWLFLYHFAPLNQEFLLRYRDAVEENGLQKIAQGFAQDRLSNKAHRWKITQHELRMDENTS